MEVLIFGNLRFVFAFLFKFANPAEVNKTIAINSQENNKVKDSGSCSQMTSPCYCPIRFVSSFIFKFGSPSEKGLSFPNWSFQPRKAMFENRKSERNTIVFRDWTMPTNSPQVRESRKILHVESGILGFGIQNTAQRIRNPSSDWNPESLQRLESRIQVPLTKTRIQYLEYRIRGVESGIQDCLGFPYMWRN